MAKKAGLFTIFNEEKANKLKSLTMCKNLTKQFLGLN